MSGAIDPAMRIKVLTFNLWLGGGQVNLAKVIEAIQASGADIVCLQEPAGNTARIAALLGWPYALPSRHVIARVPLFAPPIALGPDSNELAIAYAEVSPGGFVAIACIHLPSEESGSRALRNGGTVAQALEMERRVRWPAIAPYVAPATAMARAGLPVIIAGDFNSPSPLDGIGDNAAAWPAMQALLDAGFTDSYRAAHPDPKARPGITWSYGYPYPHRAPDEVLDRIDFIMTLGPATTVASEILGDPRMPETDIAVSPWPSDHRAVVSTLEVQPGPAPAMVSVDASAVPQGSPVTIRFHAPTEDGRIEGARIAIKSGAAPLMCLPGNDGTDRKSSVAFGTYSLAPGRYEAALIDEDGEVLATAPFWVTVPNTRPTVTMDRASFAAGASIALSWSNAPGHRFDWIGLYRQGEVESQNYLSFHYLNAAPSGTLRIAADLEPGAYEARLGLDDSLTALAGATFTFG